MASFVKLGDYTNGTPNDGSEVTTEFNNIYNAFNATSEDKEMERKLNHATKSPFDINQSGAGPLLRLQKAGANRVIYDNEGNLAIKHAVDPSITLDNDDAAAARFAKWRATDAGLLVLESDTGNIYSIDLNTRIISFTVNVLTFKETWYVFDPNDFDGNGDIGKVWIVPPVPAGTRITKFSVIRTAGSHNGGDSISFEVSKNGSGIGGAVALSDTNNLANTEYFSVLNVAVAAGDRIGIQVNSISGTPAEGRITFLVEWERKLG